MIVPFLDLQSQYREIQAEVDSAIAEVIAESAFISGPWAQRFEEAFASWNDSSYCVTCANGTDAIEIALEALGIGFGDEVIVPSMTWISTAEAVSRVGARPVFIDVGEDACIDPALIGSAITERTRAVIAVHLYGKPAAVDQIRLFCDHNNLLLVEDCAQAHGAAIQGRRVGNWGHVGTFSFFPGKNLGAYGDAGCLVTSDAGLAEECRQIRNHGQVAKHDHRRIGRNSRLDGLQAAVLLTKLPHLDRWLSIRRNTAEIYRNKISGNILLPAPSLDSEHAYHLFVVRLADRDLVAKFLLKRGISTAVHYPRGLPFLPFYRDSCDTSPESCFPKCLSLQSDILSIPMGDHMNPERANYVASMLSLACDTLRHN
ncbi:perosamine synthetase [Synechococcus sp. WH 8103]|nr:perosamine synthetase [Synechococcus sp. WH 8103]